MKELNEIRQLAKKKGTPLISVDLKGRNAISFSYADSLRARTYWYANRQVGFRKELIRLGK